MLVNTIQLAQRVLTSVRARAERHHALAIARCRYEARARGLTMHLSSDRSVAIIAESTREVWANAKVTGAVWEAIRYFEVIHQWVRATRIDGRDVIDLSRPGEHELIRSGERYFFTAMPENEAMNELYVEVGALKPGDVAIDGGAYCGSSTVAMSRAVGPAGRVLAFEPDPENFIALQRNLARHALPNVAAFCQGLWSSSGELELNTGAGMLSSLVLPGKKAHLPTIKVPVRTLEQVVEEEGLNALQLLKLDIEGAEPEVLESSRALLRAFRPRVVVEATLEDGCLNSRHLIKLLESEGYDCRVVMEVWDATWQVICAMPRRPS